MYTVIVSLLTVPQSENYPAGYVVGAMISLLILIYLLYSLFKPEKF
jgi:K+-transporting ATPase KdpF subunit